MAPKKRTRKPAKWRDELYVEAYTLALDGHSNAAIGKLLGVSQSTFLGWVNARPALAAALEKARETPVSGKSFKTIADYVYDQLPADLQGTWQEIMDIRDSDDEDEEESCLDRLNRLFKGESGQVQRQRLFLHALISSAFNMSKACSLVGITKGTLDRWISNDPTFGDLVEEMEWHKGNFFESALVNLVKKGDAGAIIFANKTFNKHRGYGEKIDLEVSGQINHIHAIVDVEKLNLPLDVRKQILIAHRATKAQDEDQATNAQEA